MERTGEVGLARKFEGQRNLDQRLVLLPEQLFGELKPLRADIVMRRSADRGLERAGKMEAAQACDRSKAGECQIIFQIGSDVIEHTRQSASIKSCLSCTGGDIARQRADGGWPAGAVNGVFFGSAMLHYRLYPAYFPAWALARYVAASGGVTSPP